jgi:hypothetical protein
LKNNISLNEAIGRKTIVLAEKLISFEDSNFVALTKAADLDPRTDFQSADLAGMDFSNSDLRGYNFTDADLRGSTGVNVSWDKTTNFTNADTTSSVFAYQLQQDAFFEANPDLIELVHRLNKEHWAGTVLGVANLLDTKRNAVGRNELWVAKALFNATRELSVRSNILYFMSPISPDPEEHRAFIYNILNRFSTETSVVKSALRTLTALYARDPGAVNILASYLDHPNVPIRNVALRGVLASPHFFRATDKILKYVIGCGDSLLRRDFVGRAARHMGPEYVAAAMDTTTKNFIDFFAPVTSRDLVKKAEANIRHEKYMRMIANAPRQGPNLEGSLKVDESEVQERATGYRDGLEQIKRRFKIPFKFED